MYVQTHTYIYIQSYMFGLDVVVSFQSLWGFVLGNHQAPGGIWSLKRSYDVGFGARGRLEAMSPAWYLVADIAVSAYQEESPKHKLVGGIPLSYKEQILGYPNLTVLFSWLGIRSIDTLGPRYVTI